jgi:hypothetical protein
MERAAALNSSFRHADKSDTAAIVELLLPINRYEDRRFGKACWTTAIAEKSVAGGPRTLQILLAIWQGKVITALLFEQKKSWFTRLSQGARRFEKLEETLSVVSKKAVSTKPHLCQMTSYARGTPLQDLCRFGPVSTSTWFVARDTA